MSADPIAEIVAGLRSSKKYGAISAGVLDRTARWAVMRYPARDALKAMPAPNATPTAVHGWSRTF